MSLMLSHKRGGGGTPDSTPQNEILELQTAKNHEKVPSKQSVNPFMPNRISHPFQLDELISNQVLMGTCSIVMFKF